MALIVSGYRSSLLHIAQPASVQIVVVLVASIAVFIVGAVFFRHYEACISDVL